MPLHPQAQQVIEATRALGLPPNHTVTPAEARANAAKRPRGAGPEVGKVENRAVPGPASDVPVRIYTPEGDGPFPILVWYHGGGWVVGDLESADGTARQLCAGSRNVVVSVDYRLAPEAKFPEPLEDCYYATIWASDHAEELGGVRGVVSVGGDSSGGNLAAAVAIRAAETGDFQVSHQLLVYPVTDARFDTGSYLDNGSGYNLERDGMIWYWEQYLADPAQAADPLAAPLQLSADFDGIDDLAQALVITAEYDPLRDEGEAYGRRLNELGVPAKVNRYDGMIHGFFSMASNMDTARDAMNDAVAFLRGAVDDVVAEYHQQHEGDVAAMHKLLDPQAAHVLELFAALNIKPFQEMEVDECRAVMNNRPRPEGPEVGRVEDRIIRNEYGKEPGDVPVRIYTPATAGPWGTLVWFHGGGWVIGNVETADPTARELCVGGNCVVVSVDYRLAPEHKFPTPFEDCLTATMWAMANAESLGSRPDAIAVGGDSAGGNLAAVISLMAADRNGPSIVHQLLVYPVTERTYQTASYVDNAEGYMLARDAMRWYWDAYLANEADAVNPYAAPMQADNVAGQPPALVITAEYDPLRDEGEAYGRRLQESGVDATVSRYDGMIHGFFGMVGVLDKSQQVMDEATAALRASFAGAAVPAPADD